MNHRDAGIAELPSPAEIEQAARVHGALGAIVWVRVGELLHPRATWFAVDQGWVLGESELPYGASVAGEAIDTGRIQIAGASHTPFPERRTVFARLGVRTVVVVPLGGDAAVAFYLPSEGIEAAEIADRLDGWRHGV